MIYATAASEDDVIRLNLPEPEPEPELPLYADDRIRPSRPLPVELLFSTNKDGNIAFLEKGIKEYYLPLFPEYTGTRIKERFKMANIGKVKARLASLFASYWFLDIPWVNLGEGNYVYAKSNGKISSIIVRLTNALLRRDSPPAPELDDVTNFGDVFNEDDTYVQLAVENNTNQIRNVNWRVDDLHEHVSILEEKISASVKRPRTDTPYLSPAPAPAFDPAHGNTDEDQRQIYKSAIIAYLEARMATQKPPADAIMTYREAFDVVEPKPSSAKLVKSILRDLCMAGTVRYIPPVAGSSSSKPTYEIINTT
jgi:hypothetical protein